MVLSTAAGNAAYIICMSPDKTGAAGSETPNGAAIYILCENYEIQDANNDNRKITSNHTVTQYSTNKLDCKVKFSNVVILPQGASSASAQLDIVRNYLYTYGSKTGAAKSYCWCYHIADAHYNLLSWDSSHTQKRYMYGKPKPTSWKSGKGKYYTASSLEFGEVTI